MNSPKNGKPELNLDNVAKMITKRTVTTTERRLTFDTWLNFGSPVKNHSVLKSSSLMMTVSNGTLFLIRNVADQSNLKKCSCSHSIVDQDRLQKQRSMM